MIRFSLLLLFFLIIPCLYGQKPSKTTGGATNDSKAIQVADQKSTKPNYYSIDLSEEVSIETQNGCFLVFPKLAFQNSDKKKVAEVNVEIKEVFTKLSLFKEGLITMNDNEPISIGGILNIQAYDKEGNSLDLAPGYKIRVEIPSDFTNQYMRLSFADAKGKNVFSHSPSSSNILKEMPITWTQTTMQPTIKEPGRLINVSSKGGKVETTNEYDKEGVKNGYLFYTDQIGWLMLSCSFKDAHKGLAPSTLSIQATETNAQIFLIPEKYNCILAPSSAEGNVYVFNNIYHDQRYTVVAFKEMADGYMFGRNDIYMKEDKKKRTMYSHIALEKVSKEIIKASIEAL